MWYINECHECADDERLDITLIEPACACNCTGLGVIDGVGQEERFCICATDFGFIHGDTGCMCAPTLILAQNSSNCVSDCYSDDGNSVLSLAGDRCVANCESADSGSVLVMIDGVRRCVCNAATEFDNFDPEVGRCVCVGEAVANLAGEICSDSCPMNAHEIDGRCECDEWFVPSDN